MNQLPDWAKHIAVFDTETTGLDLETARIVTASVLELNENGDIVQDRDEWLANPEIEIPASASAVHGITTEIARSKGRDYKTVIAEIIQCLNDCFDRGIPVVAYNAPYDFTILYHQASALGLEPIANPPLVIDPLVLDKKLDTYRKGGRKLETVAALLQVKLDDAHNSKADAIAAGRVAQAMIAKYAAQLSFSLEDLQALQRTWSIEADESFAKWMRENKDPQFVTKLGWPLKLEQ